MERLHISFFCATNSGKSTLVNALAGQEVSLVSSIPGTTTDPVRKVIEIPGLGPCVLIDTAGLDDAGVLGPERMRLTRNVIDETDIAVVLGEDIPKFLEGVPTVIYRRGESIESLIRRILAVAPEREERFLTGSLVQAGDTVLLVMPQDSEAPKGRLILPQVQVIRELLDRGCVPVCCTPDSLPAAIKSVTPALVITDSQVFKLVNETIPRDWRLTSFSILLAAAKGDMRVFLEGARAIDSLQPGSRVLIAEACTHVPDTEDIGRVKIPALLKARLEKVFPASESDKSFRRRVGEKTFSPRRTEKLLDVVIAAGNDFPEDLSQYDLIIHCGACVATSTLVRSRTRKALQAGVPITNYGLAIAHLQGILPRVVLP